MSLQTILKKVAYCVSVTFILIVGVVIVRTFLVEMKMSPVSKCRTTDYDFIPASEQVLGRFQRALQFRTVAVEKGVYDRDELLAFTEFIKSSYPAISDSPWVAMESVANYSLLYSVKGSNSSLTPYLLMAHLDVVPVETEKWNLPPFDAQIKDDFIYARGTIDFKHGVMGILEALEFLAKAGIQPKRSFYVAFGHDEEVRGEDGARQISNTLWERGVRKFEFVLDEGLTVTNKIVPGITGPVALIGTSEKGSVYLELTVEGPPSHSSMPPPESTIGILSNAIVRLERYPQPSMFGYGPEKQTVEHLAPFMQFPFKIVMANLWLFNPLVSWIMSRKQSTNAVVRTVTAVTMFKAGIKINVNAPMAKAYVNHRIHPAQSVQDVIDYDKMIINDDRVKIHVINAMEPHPISPSGETDFGFQTVKNSIRQVWTDAYTAPATMIGNTDTLHYIRMSKNIYRFSPTVMWPDDIPRFHGNNERLSIKNYEQAVNFYYHVMKNSDTTEIQGPHKHAEL